MKRQYSKPNMSVEMFQANEYIAACAKEEKELVSGVGTLYIEKDNIPGISSGDEILDRSKVYVENECHHNHDKIDVKKGQFIYGFKSYVFNVDYHEYKDFFGKKHYHMLGLSEPNAS